MRETRLSGSEGGGSANTLSLPLSVSGGFLNGLLCSSGPALNPLQPRALWERPEPRKLSGEPLSGFPVAPAGVSPTESTSSASVDAFPTQPLLVVRLIKPLTVRNLNTPLFLPIRNGHGQCQQSQGCHGDRRGF